MCDYSFASCFLFRIQESLFFFDSTRPGTYSQLFVQTRALTGGYRSAVDCGLIICVCDYIFLVNKFFILCRVSPERTYTGVNSDTPVMKEKNMFVRH